MSDQTNRDWFPKAACIFVDMERGIYPGWEKKKPKDGKYPVIKKKILQDLDISTDYHDQKGRIWENPYFLKALELERRRRDTGLATVAKEMEKVVGPLHETREKVISNVKGIFEKEPDAEDPLALSPKDYVAHALQWIRYIDETEGRTAAAKQAGIEHIMAEMATAKRMDSEMIADVVGLMKQFNDQTMMKVGMIVDGEGELVD